VCTRADQLIIPTPRRLPFYTLQDPSTGPPLTSKALRDLESPRRHPHKRVASTASEEPLPGPLGSRLKTRGDPSPGALPLAAMGEASTDAKLEGVSCTALWAGEAMKHPLSDDRQPTDQRNKWGPPSAHSAKKPDAQSPRAISPTGIWDLIPILSQSRISHWPKHLLWSSFFSSLCRREGPRGPP
jgi:hypothetical protein